MVAMPHHDGPLRVVLADDHPVVRSGLRALLDSLGGYEVVAEAASGDAAVAAVVEHRPDVVLLDVKMPGGDGVDATRRIRSAAPETAILILTMFDDRETVRAKRGVLLGRGLLDPGGGDEPARGGALVADRKA